MAFSLVPEQHPSLHRPANRLSPSDILSQSIQRLTDDMWRIMHDPKNPIIGLAAPQLGQSKCIITFEDTAELQKHLTQEQLAERGRVEVPAQTLINPEYTVTDASRICFFEGCRTYPQRLRAVLRYRGIHVRALDVHGHAIEFDASDWFARGLQHEIDHLNGTTLSDMDRVIGGPWVTTPQFQAKEYVNFSSDQLRREFGI